MNTDVRRLRFANSGYGIAAKDRKEHKNNREWTRINAKMKSRAKQTSSVVPRPPQLWRTSRPTSSFSYVGQGRKREAKEGVVALSGERVDKSRLSGLRWRE
jgi:hypothetical protein